MYMIILWNNHKINQIYTRSVRHAWAAVAAHRYELDVLRCRTSQFARFFIPVDVREWNGLHDAVLESGS